MSCAINIVQIKPRIEIDEMLHVTATQKAYHLRKLRTQVFWLDVNKDGYITRGDFDMIADRLVAHSKMITNEQADLARASFGILTDNIALIPGIRQTIEQAAVKLHEFVLSAPEKAMEIFEKTHSNFFEMIDTNVDGFISLDEYKVYFTAMAPEIAKHDVTRSFNAIDANKNGVISRGEFLSAARDFILGFEPSETSEVFFGPLL